METCNIINSIGLILDIIGVLLIFFFGIPRKIDTGGSIFLVTGKENTDEKKSVKLYNFLSHLGLIFVFIGFALQLVSNFIK